MNFMLSKIKRGSCLNANVELIAAVAEESARQLAQFARLCPGEEGELAAAVATNEAILQGDTRAGVSALKEVLDFAKERLHGRMSVGDSSRCR